MQACPPISLQATKLHQRIKILIHALKYANLTLHMIHQSSRTKTTVERCIHVLAKIVKLIEELIKHLYRFCARSQINKVFFASSDVYMNPENM